VDFAAEDYDELPSVFYRDFMGKVSARRSLSGPSRDLQGFHGSPAISNGHFGVFKRRQLGPNSQGGPDCLKWLRMIPDDVDDVDDGVAGEGGLQRRSFQVIYPLSGESRPFVFMLGEG